MQQYEVKCSCGLTLPFSPRKGGTSLDLIIFACPFVIPSFKDHFRFGKWSFANRSLRVFHAQRNFIFPRKRIISAQEEVFGRGGGVLFLRGEDLLFRRGSNPLREKAFSPGAKKSFRISLAACRKKTRIPQRPQTESQAPTYPTILIKDPIYEVFIS
jgi:hypothetical protein